MKSNKSIQTPAVGEPLVEIIVSEVAAAYLLWLLTRDLRAHLELDVPFIGAMTVDRAAAMAAWLHDVLPPHRRSSVPALREARPKPQVRHRRPPQGRR
jgi:hypothetical protein